MTVDANGDGLADSEYTFDQRSLLTEYRADADLDGVWRDRRWFELDQSGSLRAVFVDLTSDGLPDLSFGCDPPCNPPFSDCLAPDCTFAPSVLGWLGWIKDGRALSLFPFDQPLLSLTDSERLRLCRWGRERLMAALRAEAHRRLGEDAETVCDNDTMWLILRSDDACLASFPVIAATEAAAPLLDATSTLSYETVAGLEAIHRAGIAEALELCWSDVPEETEEALPPSDVEIRAPSEPIVPHP